MALLKTNTGIGTTNPTSALHVIGDARIVGVVSATSFTGNLTGTATTATNVTVTTSTTNSAFKVPFANTTANTTGNYELLQDSASTFTYNPSTDTLTVGIFSGSGASLTSLDASNISSGTLAIDSGGTNSTATPTSGGAAYGTGSAFAFTSAGTSGQILTSNGAGAPTWEDAPGGFSVTDDTSTNSTFYPVYVNVTTGNPTQTSVSSTKLNFNPSTGNFSATQFTSLSDRNKKTDIRPIENSIELTKQLEGVRFNWIDNGKSSIGLIAQQVEEVLPELVETSDDGTKSVSYGNIVGLLIEAIKEQQVRIEELEEKVNGRV